MSRPLRLAFACMACFLVLLPLALKKPGLPMQLAGDEATYYAMAASLIADGDLRCDHADLARLFNEFPFTGRARLGLTSDDDWESARFDRPVIYPLLAAPWVALWGANGPLALNAVLFTVAILCGWLGLCRVAGGRPVTGDDGHALLFCLGFFLFSTAFAYLYRMQPQVMVMATVTVAMAFGWREPYDRAQTGGGLVTRHGGWLSGSALGVAVLQEPILIVLGGPLLFSLWRSRRRDAISWLVGCAAAVGLGVIASTALIGRAWPDHLPSAGIAAEVTVDSPLEMPWHDGLPAEPSGVDEPRRSALDLLEDGGLLLWGRRTGALPYFPLIVPILALFATRAHRRGGWLLATIGVLGVAQVTLEPVARAAHEAQVGNPHLVGVYPVFLFLLPYLPRKLTVASYGLGALVLGPLLSTTLGGAVPGAGVYGHTRSLPFCLLPFEYPTLGRASGMTHLELYGLDAGDVPARLWAGTDQAEVHGDELWLLGGESAELWLESRGPLPSAVFLLRNPASGNRVTMRMGGTQQEWNFDQVPPAGASVRIEPMLEGPDKVRHDGAGARFFYRLEISTRLGEKPKWRLESAMSDYVGVGVAFLGSREHLERDLYAARWTGCGTPPRVRPEEIFLAAGGLRNASDHPWPHHGPARVRLSYRWLDADGGEVPHASSRTELPHAVEPGEQLTSWIEVQAPPASGRYVLEFDPLFENVAWFSDRDPAAICRVEIEVRQGPDQG